MSFNRVISDTGLRLGPVRFSYANVFRPRTNDDGTPGKYSLCVIIPKSDTEAYNMLKKAYEAAVALGKTTKWNGRVPSKVALPIHDGDDERPDAEAFKNCWYFNCSSKNVGVAVGLNNVIKTEDGQPLGGGRSAEADFGDMAD